MDLKEIAKNVQYVMTLLKKASKNRVMKTLVALLVGLIFVGLYGGSSFYLLHKNEKESNKRNQQVNLSSQESSVKTALDILTLCLEPTGDKKNQNWYCDESTKLYREIQRALPQRVDDVVSRKAYGAMKVDFQNHLRMIDADKARLAENNETQETLKLVLSHTTFTIALIIFALSYIGIVVLMERFSKLPEPTGQDLANDSNK